MSGQSRKVSWLGVALIAIGCTILLGKMQVFDFHWTVFLYLLMGTFGIAKLSRGFVRRRKGSIFVGAFLFLSGILGLLVEFDFVVSSSRIVFPSVFLIVGLAFLFSYSIALRNFVHLTFGLFFVALGGSFLLAELSYLDRWDVRHAVREYWPLLLIALGVSVLLSNQKQKQPVS